MAKYDANKIYNELSKLSPREQAIQLSNIKEFVAKNLEKEANEKQQEIDSLKNLMETIK